MLKPTLIRLYGVTSQVVGRNTEGVTHEDSVRPPGAAGNPMNWVLGHIVMHRDHILQALGEKPLWGPVETELYARGTTLPAEPLRFERLLDDFRLQHERLIAALEKLDEARLTAPLAEPSEPQRSPESLAWRLAFLQFHEAYHGGQLGLLRRLLGRPGGIA